MKRKILSFLLCIGLAFGVFTISIQPAKAINFFLDDALEQLIKLFQRTAIFVESDEFAPPPPPPPEPVEIPEDMVKVIISYPEAQSVPAGATNVVFLSMRFDNPLDENVLITRLTFLRKGLGSPEDFDSVTLFEGLRRITSPTNVNNQSEANFRLSSVPLVIPARTSVILTLRGNLVDDPATNSHENSFILKEIMLESPTGEQLIPTIEPEGVTAIRSVPVDIENTLLVEHGPTISNPNFLVLQSESIFGYFKLSSESETDIIIQSVTLEVSQHARVLRQMYLEDRTTKEKICEAESVDTTNNFITFDCGRDGYRLDRSNNRTIAIRGALDLGFGIVSRTDTLEFRLREPEDIIAITSNGGAVKIVDEY